MISRFGNLKNATTLIERKETACDIRKDRIFQVLSVLDRMSIGAVVRALSLSGETEKIQTKAFPWFRELHLTELRISTLQAFRHSIKMTLQRCGSMLFSECT